jgi:hypothetical protein
MLVVASSAWIDAIREHKVPPRCRNVEAGAGCIDWLEPGETKFPSISHKTTDLEFPGFNEKAK